MRLASLEAIELVIREKVELEKYMKEDLEQLKQHLGVKQLRATILRETVGWDKLKSIYKFLS